MAYDDGINEWKHHIYRSYINNIIFLHVDGSRSSETTVFKVDEYIVYRCIGRDVENLHDWTTAEEMTYYTIVAGKIYSWMRNARKNNKGT